MFPTCFVTVRQEKAYQSSYYCFLDPGKSLLDRFTYYRLHLPLKEKSLNQFLRTPYIPQARVVTPLCLGYGLSALVAKLADFGVILGPSLIGVAVTVGWNAFIICIP